MDLNHFSKSYSLLKYNVSCHEGERGREREREREGWREGEGEKEKDGGEEY